jgi:hypothetical protein
MYGGLNATAMARPLHNKVFFNSFIQLVRSFDAIFRLKYQPYGTCTKEKFTLNWLWNSLFSWNPEVCYCVHKIPPFEFIVRKFNRVRTLKTYFSNTGIVSHIRLVSPKFSPHLRLFGKILWTLSFLHALTINHTPPSQLVLPYSSEVTI